jgi:pimeloyl-ACP methyl ester carboxylesterase
VKTIRTPSLELGYLESGPPSGTPVVLVHGFPDDALTWSAVSQPLAEAGYRTIAPYVRGFGPTRLRPGEPASGEIAALAADAIDLIDALGLERVHYIGHDWGARAGYVAAALVPGRFLSLTALAVAYGTNVASQRLSIAQTRAYWYQWYFATPRGEAELSSNRAAFCRALWRYWSPGWAFGEDEFARTAASFENPEFVPVVVHSYRQRWGFAPGEARYAKERAAIEQVDPIAVDTLAIMGADDGATLPGSADGTEHLFRGRYERDLFERCGHFIQRERPDDLVRRWLRFAGARP